ncbi:MULTISPECIES: hypothetical protein [Pseudomonas]|uniref:hypothetical protein n=1 Tax=Pseudomonas TaxID=286 RepID=UPI00059174E5|nr:hypothetical protein [Pseudomonas massiliensis]
MNLWRPLFMLVLLASLSGCLATFDEPIAPGQKAPAGLMGHWRARDAFGNALRLSLRPAPGGRYTAINYQKGSAGPRDEVTFTVTRHGGRWYASAPMPKAYGGRFALVGFELSGEGELVVYSLDLQRLQQAISQGALAGDRFETEEGQGVAIRSTPAQVFAWLDDPANSDVFVETARYSRAAQ